MAFWKCLVNKERPLLDMEISFLCMTAILMAFIFHFKEYDTQILGENFMMALNKFYYNAFSYIPDKEHIVFLENPQTN